METKRKPGIVRIHRLDSDLESRVVVHTRDGGIMTILHPSNRPVSYTIRVPKGKRRGDILRGIGSVMEIQRTSTIAEVVTDKALDGRYMSRVRRFGDHIRQVASSIYERRAVGRAVS